MQPKEKAKELFDKYYNYTADMGDPNECAKQCALIAINEIINNCGVLDETGEPATNVIKYNYWQKVRQDIEKL